jgi:hypothetical protein
VLLWTVLGGILLFGLIQLVPYGRDHSNPPVNGKPSWDSPETRALAVNACFDCHSNETKWPWYSNVAPASWLVQSDVDRGRETLNFSEWNRPQEVETEEMEEVIRGGSMPPWYYLVQHSNARLSGTEKDQLIRGLDATIAASRSGR